MYFFRFVLKAEFLDKTFNSLDKTTVSQEKIKLLYMWILQFVPDIFFIVIIQSAFRSTCQDCSRKGVNIKE